MKYLFRVRLRMCKLLTRHKMIHVFVKIVFWKILRLVSSLLFMQSYWLSNNCISTLIRYTNIRSTKTLEKLVTISIFFKKKTENWLEQSKKSIPDSPLHKIWIVNEPVVLPLYQVVGPQPPCKCFRWFWFFPKCWTLALKGAKIGKNTF